LNAVPKNPIVAVESNKDNSARSSDQQKSKHSNRLSVVVSLGDILSDMTGGFPHVFVKVFIH
jgi:hypothetical protein